MIFIFLAIAVLVLSANSNELIVPNQFSLYTQLQKQLTPSDIKCPSDLIYLQANQILKQQCGISLSEDSIQLQAYQVIGQILFYIVFKTYIGFVSVYAVWDHVDPTKNKTISPNYVNIIRVNVFDQYDDLLQSGRQEQDSANLIVDQQLQSSKKSVKNDAMPIFQLYLKSFQKKKGKQAIKIQLNHKYLKDICQKRKEKRGEGNKSQNKKPIQNSDQIKTPTIQFSSIKQAGLKNSIGSLTQSIPQVKSDESPALPPKMQKKQSNKNFTSSISLSITSVINKTKKLLSNLRFEGAI